MWDYGKWVEIFASILEPEIFLGVTVSRDPKGITIKEDDNHPIYSASTHSCGRWCIGTSTHHLGME